MEGVWVFQGSLHPSQLRRGRAEEGTVLGAPCQHQVLAELEMHQPEILLKARPRGGKEAVCYQGTVRLLSHCKPCPGWGSHPAPAARSPSTTACAAVDGKFQQSQGLNYRDYKSNQLPNYRGFILSHWPLLHATNALDVKQKESA